MKRFVIYLALSAIAAAGFAQGHHPHNNDQPRQNADAEASAIRFDKDRPHTGASRKYVYTISKMAVPDEIATDVKFTLTASTQNHKITIKCDHNDGRISWKLADGEGTLLDENWWSGKSCTVAFGRYGAGEYYLNLIDALGKEAHYLVKKSLKE